MTSHSSGVGRGNSMRDFLSKASSNMSDLKMKASNHSSRLSSSISGRSTTTSNVSSDELRQPMPEITRPFPVVEQPPRCILTSVSDNNIRLTSTKKGLVDTTSNRGDKELFLLMPAVKNCNDEGDVKKRKDVYYLKSYKFNRYVTSDSETGEVSTVKISAEINNNVENNDEEEEEEKKKDWVAAAKAKAESALADNSPTKSELGDTEQ
eukprot:scaffold3023_cov68-Skeletonema_marinoi.AAC.3